MKMLHCSESHDSTSWHDPQNEHVVDLHDSIHWVKAGSTLNPDYLWTQDPKLYGQKREQI